MILFCLTVATEAAEDKEPVFLENPAMKVLHQQKKVYYMKQGIKAHKVIIQQTSTKKRNLLAQLEDINRRLKEQHDTIQELNKTIKGQEKLILQKENDIEKIQGEKEALRGHMLQRLSAYYRMGEIGMLNVMFSNANLGDFLNFNEYFHYIVRHDQQVIVDYRDKIVELSDARARLSEGRERLLASITQVKEQEGLLLSTKRDRNKLLTEVQNEKALYLQALVEIEDAANQLTATIENLKKEAQQEKEAKIAAAQEADAKLAAEKKAAAGKVPVLDDKAKKPVLQAKESIKIKPDSTPTVKYSLGGFPAQKGRLDPPAQGTVITYFGKNTRGKFGVTTFENGIDIKIPAGTKIKAIYPGIVVYAGVLRGYGKLMIIDHGDQYYSLISRVAELNKKEKDTVDKGEIIAIMSDESGLLNEGLHFEIRHGAKPINPLQWLNSAKLKLNGTRHNNS